jgi:hypothetical protein
VTIVDGFFSLLRLRTFCLSKRNATLSLFATVKTFNITYFRKSLLIFNSFVNVTGIIIPRSNTDPMEQRGRRGVSLKYFFCVQQKKNYSIIFIDYLRILKTFRVSIKFIYLDHARLQYTGI